MTGPPFTPERVVRFRPVTGSGEPGGRRTPSAYRPNSHSSFYLRLLRERSDEEIDLFVRWTEQSFRKHYGLTSTAPRHDIMDHCLPLATPLNTSHIHEIFADLVKYFLLGYLGGEEPDSFPAEFLGECIEWRREYYNWDPSPDIGYIRRWSPLCFRSVQVFYRALGRPFTRRLWDAGCRRHYELKGLPYRDDYFSGNPNTDADRCG
jgi:hypothetical protein